MSAEPDVYPFCAVVGQERAKRALLLHALHPRLGGVLLCGEPGTAKTTLTRGLAELLPVRSVAIPLHATEDRLLGELDAQAAVRRGERRLSPGLLAAADGGLVTIDDANRLPERLLKAVLQAAETGSHAIEREGLSATRASRFRLFGTMSPAEGELPPALRDRWGLCVRVVAAEDAAERVEIVRRRLAFEADPAAFVRRWEAVSAALRERIAGAARVLPAVRLSEAALRLAAEVAAAAQCPGHRADLALAETARAIAAWDGAAEALPAHVREAAGYALPHRMARAQAVPPAEADAAGRGEADRAGAAADAAAAAAPEAARERPPRAERADGAAAAQREASGGGSGAPRRELAGAGGPSVSGPEAPADDGGAQAREVVEAVGRDFAVRRFEFAPPRLPPPDGSAGKRNRAAAGARRGRYVRAAAPQGRVRDLALDATLRAAAPFQRLRRERAERDGAAAAPGLVRIERGDLREKVRERRTGTALLFAVDASGSMNAAKRMRAVKGAVLSLLRDAYRQRDHAGLIAFRGDGAELLLDLTRSVELAERKLRTLPTGGRTPLAAGLAKGAETLRTALRKRGALASVLIVITDGRANAGVPPGNDPWQESRRLARRIAASGLRSLVIDTEQGAVRLGFAQQLAADLQAQYCRLEELEAGGIEQAVRGMKGAARGRPAP